jgi:hypothetical protein
VEFILEKFDQERAPWQREINGLRREVDGLVRELDLVHRRLRQSSMTPHDRRCAASARDQIGERLVANTDRKAGSSKR